MGSVREERESQRVMERRKMAGLEELKRRVNVMEEAVGRGGGFHSPGAAFSNSFSDVGVA